MTDKKLTDNEIVKALECCKYEYDTKCELCCYNFYSRTGCRSELRRNALDLINRLQAENERLNEIVKTRHKVFETKCEKLENSEAELDEYKKIKKTIDEFWEILLTLSLFKRKEKPTLEEFAEAIQEIKSEAYKEFAERLKNKGMAKYKTIDNEYLYEFDDIFIDNILKELEEK